MDRSSRVAASRKAVAPLPLRGLLFRFGASVMSDGQEKVPTGGELTRFEAVGPAGPDFLLLCRSSPVGDVRRDLIGAWQRPRASHFASCPPLVNHEDEVHDRARCG